MKTRFFCILIFIVFVYVSGFVYGAIPAEERAALIALYNGTNGDNWTNNNGWKTPPLDSDGFAMPGTEGDWYGITVVNDHVTVISLGEWPDGNNLIGTIPAEIGNLSQLMSLILSYNQLSGSIPPGLGNLNNLSHLALNDNQLSGNIPPELGNLYSLRTLYMSYNQLTGTIPPELGNLSHLLGLSFWYNQLSGTIPPELGNLTDLTSFAFPYNQLSGTIPDELKNLKNVRYFQLQSNQLTGEIPSWLGTFSSVEHLYLDHNQFTGTIPVELGNLTNLKNLKLYSNQLTGGIPAELGSLCKIEQLGLGSNQLTGNIPPELGNLRNLNFLSLSMNQFCGRIPSELGNIDNLNNLYLNGNQLTGTIPAELGNLTQLKYLWLRWNHLTGDIPANLMNLTNLESLYIVGNCLETNDSDLRAWLDSLEPDWESHQDECPNDTGAPFGTFETPIHGSTVAGSIPVTGWVLDDVGVQSVKIYREEGSALIYIGDGIQVEGARPDVAADYPTYPDNTRAGWGYMLLSNFLPNAGNGTFTLHAIATDVVGKATTLGTKTITCDNENAVKPFGAIDTPIQGGSASGDSFTNWGWVLTPNPNSIPMDGSTINVWVDGLNIGNPTYNIYREDIAVLFPGYANSDGAIGHFSLDTSGYTTGVHTIYWTATDSGGNSDGIGSRYFSIQNTCSGSSVNKVPGETSQVSINSLGELMDLPVDSFEPINIRKGYGRNIQPRIIYPDAMGISRIEIKELERIELHLSNADSGYLIAGNKLHPLPVGSTLDKTNGTFSWIPGPGFLGEYSMVFVEKNNNGNLSRKYIRVNIVPKFKLERQPGGKLF
jgi:Leucine-rich repeat (LRR) protein